MHPTVAAFASPFLPFIRHAKSAPSCKAKTLANAQVFRPSTAEIYPLNSTKILYSVQLAQRAADKACDRFAETKAWYGKYDEVLQAVGWTTEQYA
ncbi:MAG: hypothetical protein WAR76_10445, partial [Xanthobacteraceae bacterium]